MAGGGAHIRNRNLEGGGQNKKVAEGDSRLSGLCCGQKSLVGDQFPGVALEDEKGDGDPESLGYSSIVIHALGFGHSGHS